MPTDAAPPMESALAGWIKSLVPPSAAPSVEVVSEDRITRAYRELLCGYEIDLDSILNETVRVDGHSGLVRVTDLDYVSMCLHHFLPFFGTVTVVYQPRHIITGLGKIARLVRAASRRFQLQELLVKDIAQAMATRLDPIGVFVEATGSHLCMHGRGPLAFRAQTRCSYGLGIFDGQSVGLVPDGIGAPAAGRFMGGPLFEAEGQ